MTVDDKVTYEKLQHDINAETAKISALSSDNVDKYELLKDLEKLLSDQSRIMKQANFTYHLLVKHLKNKQK